MARVQVKLDLCQAGILYNFPSGIKTLLRQLLNAVLG